MQRLVLSVFDDFGLRATTLQTLEGAPVVIWLVGFDATKPHRCLAVRTLWLLQNQSRWIKNGRCGHGMPPCELPKHYLVRAGSESSRRLLKLSK
jgi:hypothetical protein